MRKMMSDNIVFHSSIREIAATHDFDWGNKGHKICKRCKIIATKSVSGDWGLLNPDYYDRDMVPEPECYCFPVITSSKKEYRFYMTCGEIMMRDVLL